jgi:hypothetical protein
MKFNWTYNGFIWIFIGLLSLTACAGTVQHKVDFKSGYTTKVGTKIDVGKVLNNTGSQFQINIEQLLRESLVSKLKNAGLLYEGVGDRPMIMDTKIIDYAEGDAAKRWLMPGSGATVLSIQSVLRDGSDVVGSVDARRTVTAGGLYSAGAWKTIFGDLADDVVTDLSSKMPK